MSDAPAMAERPPREVASEPGQPRVFIDADVESAIEQHVHSDSEHEVCGVLLGVPGKDDAGVFVHVTRAVEGKFADERGTSVTFTHETWDYIYRLMDDEGDAAIVGWYHSHPGFGVFYSSHDSFIQEHFFGHAWQVGLVIDPSTDARGIFANLDDEIRGLPAYWRIRDADPSAVAVECEYQDPIAARDPEAEQDAPVDVSHEALLAELTKLNSQLNTVESVSRRTRLVATCSLLLSVATLVIVAWIGIREWSAWRESLPIQADGAANESPSVELQVQDDSAGEEQADE